MNATIDSTIREIINDDFRAATVFQRFGIDFCCGGWRTVESACREKQLDARVVLDEVAHACEEPDEETPRFGSWGASALIAHIVGRHHAYVRRTLPAILSHTAKIADVHGERHPELRDVAELMTRVAADMDAHMAREEAILFPYVESLAKAMEHGSSAPDAFFGSVANPIAMMEQDHEHAGDALALIRDLTDGYRVPQDACRTYRICLQELEEFERDLHTHVHLENNVLFPEALQLERRLQAGDFSAHR